jgi:acyl-coenzyme A synthetase/AMP-(fatty) acid ligase
MWCTHEGDAEMKQALVASADEVVLLLDSSKFFYSAVMKVADLSAVSTVITDQLVSDSARHAVEQAGAGLVVVQAEPGDLGGVSEALDPNADDASVGPASSSEDTASARSADQGGIE